MQAKVNTTEGKKVYARRKAIVEPVYGQVKGAARLPPLLVPRFAEERAPNECLMCLTHNLLKIWRHQCAVEVS